MAQSLGSAFVDLAVRGFQTVVATMNQVETVVANASGTANVAVAGVPQAQAAVGKFQALLDSVKSNVVVRVAVAGAAAAMTALKGLQAVASQVGQQIGQLSQGLQKLGGAATAGLAAASASMYKFVQLADPVGFERFTLAVQRLGLQLGRLFIPIVREATKNINDLANFFKNLDDSTRETILAVTKVALAVLSIGAAVGAVVKVAGVFASLGAVFTPVGGAIAAIAAAVGLLGVSFARAQGMALDFTSVAGLVKSVWTGVLALFQRFQQAIQPAIQTIQSVFSELMASSAVVDTLARGLAIVAKVGNEAFNAYATVVAALAPRLGVIASLLIDTFTKIQPIITALADKFETFVSVGAAKFNEFVAAFTGLVDELMPVIATALDYFVIAVESSFATLEPLIDFAISSVLGFVDAVIAGLNFVKMVVSGVVDFIYDAVDVAVEVINKLIAAYNETVGEVAGKLKELDKPTRKTFEIKEQRKFEFDRPKNTDPDKFRGDVRPKNEVIGLEELFRKNLTASQEDPALQLQREQLENSRQQTSLLQDIKNNQGSDIRR